MAVHPLDSCYTIIIMYKKLLLTFVVVLGFLLFPSVVHGAFTTAEDNVPREPVAGECLVKWRGAKNGSGSYDMFMYKTINPDTFNVLRVSSNSLGFYYTGTYTVYYWNGSAWAVDSDSTMDKFLSTVNFSTSPYTEFLSTCDVRGYSTYTLTSGAHGLPNPWTTTSGELEFPANWMTFYPIPPWENNQGDWLSHHITFKTISPDSRSDRDHLRVGFDDNNCYIYSAGASEHYLRCVTFFYLYDPQVDYGGAQVIESTTSFKISDTTDICGNILASDTPILDGSGDLACNMPTNPIDDIMPPYTGIGWEIPEDDWGTFEFLKDIFKTLFDFFDTSIGFFYTTIRNIVDFFIPDMYMISDFFTTQYNIAVDTFQIQAISQNLEGMFESFIDGIGNSSYSPNISITFHGTTTDILDLDAFKTLYNSSALKGVVTFSLVALCMLQIVSLIRNIISYK